MGGINELFKHAQAIVETIKDRVDIEPMDYPRDHRTPASGLALTAPS
jgi:hypothetical protein